MIEEGEASVRMQNCSCSFVGHHLGSIGTALEA
jgi:hypothetical protein